MLERIYTPDVVEVAELEDSVRGAGGFGSTGGFGGAVAPEKSAVSLDGASDAPAATAAVVVPAGTVAGNEGEEAKIVDVEMKNGGGEQKPSS